MLFFIWGQDFLQVWSTGISEPGTPCADLCFASLWLGTPCTHPGHQLLPSSPQLLQGPGKDTNLARDTRHSSELSHGVLPVPHGFAVLSERATGSRLQLSLQCSATTVWGICKGRSWQAALWCWKALWSQSTTFQGSYWASETLLTHYKPNISTTPLPPSHFHEKKHFELISTSISYQE